MARHFLMRESMLTLSQPQFAKAAPEPMLRLPFLVAIALLTAFGLGISSAVGMLDASSGFGAIRIGPWAAFPEAQTTAADPYARAHRARSGELLYATAEGLQFQAATDDNGDRLTPRCTYAIDGLPPPARFWTLYAASQTMVPLTPARYLPQAFNAWNVLRRADGSFRVLISARAQPGNWLALNEGQPFRLVMTLLDTPTAGSSGLLEIRMPKLEKVSCP